MARMLLEYGANIGQYDHKYMSVYDRAAKGRFEYSRSMTKLVENWAQRNDFPTDYGPERERLGESWTKLHENAVDGQLRRTEYLINKDDGSWDVLAEPMGKSVFFTACENGHVELAIFLAVGQCDFTV